MKLVKVLIRSFVVLVLALAASTAMMAQATGSIVGSVTDRTGAVIPEAKITLTNFATAETKVAQSGPNGTYQFLQLTPGNYKVAVEKAGFQQFVVQPVEVTVGNASRTDAALQVGSANQTVEVTSEAALLNTQTSSLNYSVESKQVEQLPLNGRNPLNLAELSPGVVPQGGSTNANPATSNTQAWGNYQIGGGVAGQSATFIDGSPINVGFANSAVLIPIQDGVQEFQISTNNVSPEYGRFAGGIINMATKPGGNTFHGSAYDYVRNAALNANLWFDKHVTPVLPRPVYTQNQYGLNVGGPIRKEKAYFFMGWEQVDLKRATLTNTTVPTPAMLTGDFSAVSAQLYDPTNATCGANGAGLGSGTQRCAYTVANGYAGYNMLPAAEVNQAALKLSKMLWPSPTNSNNPSTGATNFSSNVANITDSNQWTVRGDDNIGAKNKLFARFTDWHKNLAGASAYGNQVFNRSGFGTDQAVLGDTITFTQTLLADIRASYLRYRFISQPASCCNFNYGNAIGPGWANIQSSVTFPQLPTPNVTGMANFNTIPIQFDTDNVYTLSVAMTKVLGRHTIEFGGEMRKIEWDYAQSNSAGTTFNSPSSQGFTSSSSNSGATGGYGFASWLLGFPTYAQAAEPASSKGVMFYSGLYVNDSFRMTPKLTINAGLRWERPGSYTETHGRLSALLLNLPQPAVSAALGRTVTGGLGLINSPQYPHKDWQQQSLKLFGPRLGFAYSPTSRWVVRGGFGVTYLPSTGTFSLGPYVDPLNLATTTITSSGQTPTISLTNPFPSGIAAPISGRVPLSTLQANIDGLLGSGIQSALPSQPYSYAMQWNAGIQKQLGNSASVNVGYVGSKGNHLPLFSVNEDQLPDQYDICGTDKTQPQCNGHLLTDVVMNPLSAANGGPIPTSVPTLGPATVQYGYLLKPYPQYLYMTADAPNIGFTWYQALQVSAEKRFKSGGVLGVAWTFSNLVGTADSLIAYVEASRFNVGGGEGIQDNTNIKGNASNPGENSRASFQTPNRVVVSYVYPLPFGRGKWLLSNANGLVDKIVGNWTVNGLSTFQNGFPIAFQDNNPNALENNYAEGYAGPVLGAGVTRPNFVSGCNPKISGKPSQRLNGWYNTACYTVPGSYQFGNEPRVDPYIRAQGIDNSDFSAAKDIPFGDHYRLDFRAEFFNIFNWTQFSVPNNQADNPASVGKVTAQYNQPRLVQISGRFTF